MRIFWLAGCLILSLAGSASAQWPWHGYGHPRWGYGYGEFSPYGIYYHPRSNEVAYVLPPLYAPAELAYGPGAMKQFMGVDRTFALGPLANPPAAAPAPLLAPVAPGLPARSVAVDRPALPRVSNPETRLLATKFVGYGDTKFKLGNWSGALDRFRTATTLAPDLMDARLKTAIALIVLDRPEEAITTIKSLLALEPTALQRKSAIDSLYGDRAIARESHLESLARGAFATPDDPRPFLLLGWWFLSEGDLARAKKFLSHAASLGGEHAPVAQSLLPLTDGERH